MGPVQRRDPRRRSRGPGAFGVDDLGLIEKIGRFHQGVVATIPDRTDRGSHTSAIRASE